MLANKPLCCQQRRPFSSARQTGRLRRIVARATPAAPATVTLQELKQWANSTGITADALTIAPGIESNEGLLVANRDISAGEPITKVNDNLWLSPDLVSRQLPKSVSALEPWLQIAVLLMVEKNNPKSPWQTYIKHIEATNNNPLLWSSKDIEHLKGTQLLKELASYREFFKSKFTELTQPGGALAGGLPGLLAAEDISWDKFLWAVAAVRSRTHPPLELSAIALVPLADAVRHRRDGNVMWKVKPSGLLGRSKQLVVEAARKIRKGEEVCLDYGPSAPDNTLLLDHGVMDTASPKPGYKLALNLSDSDKWLDDKLDILESSAGLGPSMEVVLTPGDEPSTNMLGFLRLMQVSGPDAFLLESVFRGEAWDHMCNPLSPDNENAVCSTMISGAQEALAGYPTTLEQDLALVKSGRLVAGSREELAVKVRLGEKESLDAVLRFFEQRRSGLRELEYYQERRLKRLGLMTEDGRTTYDSFFKDSIA